MVNREGYGSYRVDEYLEDAKEYLKGKNYAKTNRLARALGITGKRAAAIFYRLGWTRWSNDSKGTTFAREG